MKQRTGGKYIPDDTQTLVHVDAVLKLLSVMTGDDSYQNLQIRKEGGISMCDVAQRLLAQGRAEGRIEGIAEGEDRVTKLYRHLMSQNKTEELKKAMDDAEYRAQLMRTLGL